MTTSLNSTPVLFIDCQTTATTPSRGRILQLAWARGTASDTRVPLHSRYVGGDDPLPPKVRRMTGIREAALEGAASEPEVWNSFLLDPEIMATPFAVIHYARFELGFFEALQSRYHNGEKLPFSVVCTYQMAKRLLPGVTSYGIRALSGYFGETLPESHEATTNVGATQRIWRHLLEILFETESIDSFASLLEWLARPAERKAHPRVFLLARERRLSLPDSPGVYRFLSRDGKVLYVGKASSLKSRVNSYFRGKLRGRSHGNELLAQVADLDVTSTPTSLEAALLECDEIKRWIPPYNVSLREDERRLAYFSPDFTEGFPEPSERSSLGPFPSIHQFRGIQSLMLTLREGERLPDWFPETVTRETFEKAARSVVPEELWREPTTRLAAYLRRFPDPEEADQQEPGEEADEWTPERIARSIVKMGAGAQLAARRARWLCRLMEADLAWAPDGERWRRLEVRGGRISPSEPCDGAAAFVPPAWNRKRRERQRSFDIATYDRLRTLATGLRALAQSQAPLRLCLSPRVVLSGDEILRLLR